PRRSAHRHAHPHLHLEAEAARPRHQRLAGKTCLPAKLARANPAESQGACPGPALAWARAVRAWPLLLVVGCSTSTPPPRAVAPLPEPDGLAPAPGRYLHKKAAGGDRFQTADGLVTPAGLYETAAAYYAAQLVGIRAPAPYPRDLREWKRTFGFPQRAPGASLADYRARANVAVYYNENELGLGRELACSRFTTERRHLRGQACIVTNYGQNFNDREGALRDAVAGVRAKNTVAILFNPELPPGSRVNFWVYGGAEAPTTRRALSPRRSTTWGRERCRSSARAPTAAPTPPRPPSCPTATSCPPTCRSSTSRRRRRWRRRWSASASCPRWRSRRRSTRRRSGSSTGCSAGASTSR